MPEHHHVAEANRTHFFTCSFLCGCALPRWAIHVVVVSINEGLQAMSDLSKNDDRISKPMTGGSIGTRV